MAQIVAGTNIALRLDELDLANLIDGTFTTRTTTSAVIDIGAGYIETFTGTGFTYDQAGDPIGGTITGIRETLNGQLSFEVSGLNISVAQFVDWAHDGENYAAFQSMLSGNDNFTGSSLADYVEGFAGHDNLFGGSGSDTLGGGDGNDHLYGQSASGGADSGDRLFGDAGADYLQGNAGNDTLEGGLGSDRINGGADNDSILGGSGNDTINGNLGSDTINAGDGNDSLRGGQGNDILGGGTGNDSISGDLGSDTIVSGSGFDVLLFSGQASAVASPDTVEDFANTIDVFSLGFRPVEVLTGAAQGSASAAATAAQQLFDGSAGDAEVAALAVGSNTYLFYGSNGGATIDSAIVLLNTTAGAVDVTDFI